MYSITAYFTVHSFTDDTVPALNYLLSQWRNNGQIIGREFVLFEQNNRFVAQFISPEMDSLFDDYHSVEVKNALEILTENHIRWDSYEVNGADFNSDHTADGVPDEKPPYQILYTTFLDSCSPLHSGADLGAIPLYTLKNQSLSEQILQWQENWQACDQLQMNGGVLEKEALEQISNPNSALAQQGRALCAQIEEITGVPTYYYLYRLGKDKQTELSRPCPLCAQQWKQSEPLHDYFHFQCEADRLVSNLSWEIQG